MGAIDAELTADATGDRLFAESLANVLAINLTRHVHWERSQVGMLPQSTLRTVIDYIEGHLEASLTLEQMAAVAHLSPYHFARQFKKATGLPPHQYVIARRVERAKILLRQSSDLSLMQVAVRVGFSDQSQLTRHFKRIVGVTPGQFRRH